MTRSLWTRRQILSGLAGTLLVADSWIRPGSSYGSEGRMRPLLATARSYAETAFENVPDGDIDEALGINTAGITVGRSTNRRDSITVPVIWPDLKTVRVLPTLEGGQGEAWAINEEGIIAGASTDADGHSRPVIWIDDAVEDLGTLGGGVGVALGLNNRGHVVGWAEDSDGNPMPFLWQEGEMLNLGQLAGSMNVPELSGLETTWITAMGGGPKAWDINEAGQIVGEFGFVDVAMRAVVWQDGEAIDLGSLGDDAGARAINEVGQVVGYSVIADANGHTGRACIWEEGRIIDLGIPDDAASSLAVDINQSGAVAVRANIPDDSTSAYIWHDGEYTLLSSWPVSEIYALNDDDISVGTTEIGGQSFAVRWTPRG